MRYHSTWLATVRKADRGAATRAGICLIEHVEHLADRYRDLVAEALLELRVRVMMPGRPTYPLESIQRKIEKVQHPRGAPWVVRRSVLQTTFDVLIDATSKGNNNQSLSFALSACSCALTDGRWVGSIVDDIREQLMAACRDVKHPVTIPTGEELASLDPTKQVLWDRLLEMGDPAEITLDTLHEAYVQSVADRWRDPAERALLERITHHWPSLDRETHHMVALTPI